MKQKKNMTIKGKGLRVILILISLGIFSCTNLDEQSENNSYTIIHLTNLNDLEELRLSKFINDVKIIPLEFNKSCIIGKIKKIEFFENRIFIQDELNNESILMFDFSGHFIKNIGFSGRGPKEHIDLTDFSVDENNKNLVIYDNGSRKFIKYDLNGDFIGEINSKFSADNFEVNDNFYYLFRDNPSIEVEHSLVVEDKTGEIEERYFETNLDIGSRIRDNIFSKYNKEMIITRPYNDTVYSHRPKLLNKKYYVNFGENKIRTEDLKTILKNPTQANDILIKNKYATGIKNFMEQKNIVYFSFTYNSIQYSCFYNKKSKEVFFNYSLLNDINYIFFPSPIFIKDNILLSVFDPSLIPNNIDYIENLIKDKTISSTDFKISENLKILTDLKSRGLENNNPILLWATLK